MKIAASVVVCGLLLAGCSSGGSAKPAATTTAPSLSDPGNIAGTVAPTPTKVRGSNDPVTPSDAAASDTAACHLLLDPLQVGTVTATALDAVVLPLSFPNGTGASAVNAGRPVIVMAQSLASSAALGGALTALLSQVDSYGTSAQSAPGEVGTTTATIRSACEAVGVAEA